VIHRTLPPNPPAEETRTKKHRVPHLVKEEIVPQPPFVQSIRAIAAFSALVLLPGSAASLQLFEGNLGYDSEWLQVLDAPAMGDQVFWYALGDDVTYQVQFANDIGFTEVVLDERGIVPNYVVPGLASGFYHFRVRETHSSGVTGSWSRSGTLDVAEDLKTPQAGILSPVKGQTFSPGATIPIELEVSDDTLLHLARFTIGGSYAGVLGLKAENFKLKPSFGEARTVVFDYQLPSKGKTGPLEISVDVTDVTHKSVTSTVVINVAKATSDGEKRSGRRRKK
jgi:hypothetical protein